MFGTTADCARPARKYPRRAGTPRALGRDAAAPVAVASSITTYTGSLPQLTEGAVLPVIERAPNGVSVDLAYVMAEAGFHAKLPARGCSPADWLARAMENLVAGCVPETTHGPVYVGLLTPYGGDGMPLVAVEVPADGELIVALQPGLRALRDKAAAAVACSIVNSSLFVMGPDRFFDELQHYYWHGEDTEEAIVADYAAQGEVYDGITRAQWDEVYPDWSFGWRKHRQCRGGLTALSRIADGRSRAAPLARALLKLRAAEEAVRKLTPRNFGVDIGEAIGYDTWISWGIPLIWSRKENLTAMVLDAMYDNAMQSSCDLSVTAYQLPEASAGVASMRAFRRVLEATLREFAAASEVCIAFRALENEHA